jgi:sulfur transfer protein SufE
VFKTGRDAVSVDVIVRDRDGNIVRGLTAADFEIREDGRPQDILSFSFEEIAEAPLPQ